MENSLVELEKFSSELADQLIKKKWTIALAESCTGGWIAKVLTDLSGSSQWFELGVVTYSNFAKERILDVPSSLLKSYGAVSEPVAQAMVEGVVALAGANVGISVTGIAGPTGGYKDKPVGTVCFGFYSSEKGLSLKTVRFPGGREDVRRRAVAFALSNIVADLAGK